MKQIIRQVNIPDNLVTHERRPLGQSLLLGYLAKIGDFN